MSIDEVVAVSAFQLVNSGKGYQNDESKSVDNYLVVHRVRSSGTLRSVTVVLVSLHLCVERCIVICDGRLIPCKSLLSPLCRYQIYIKHPFLPCPNNNQVPSPR